MIRSLYRLVHWCSINVLSCVLVSGNITCNGGGEIQVWYRESARREKKNKLLCKCKDINKQHVIIFASCAVTLCVTQLA